MSLSNLFEYNDFSIYVKNVDGSTGPLNIGKDESTTELHLGDTSTPVYINEVLYGGGGGALSLAVVGSVPNNNGMSLASNVLNLQPADATHAGVLSTTDQTISGPKTFNNGILLANATASYTPLSLDYYETFSTTYAMTGAANVNFVCTFTRIGRLVNLTWQNVDPVATTSAGRLSTIAGTVPTRFSANNISTPICAVNDISTIVTGNLYYLTGGAIAISCEGNANFPFPGYCGFLPGGMTYSI